MSERKRATLSPDEKAKVLEEKKELAKQKCEIEEAKRQIDEKKAIFESNLKNFRKKWNLKNNPQLGKCVK